MNESHTLKIEKSVEVITQGNPDNAKHIWVSVHGYGQQAQFFQKHFQALAEQGHYVVVPNAINEFYWEGYTGKVGSNWMTSYRRELAIQDQLEYGNRLFSHFVKPYMKGDVKLHLFGFSQGAYTASRWATMTHMHPDSLVCFAGRPADDVLMSEHSEKLKNTRLAMAWGDKDEFISPEAIRKIEQMDWFKALNVKQFPFQGEHKVYPEVLTQLTDWAMGVVR